MTLQTQQWLAYTASHNKEMTTMRKQLEDCMRTNSNTPPPVVINKASENDCKRRRGPLSDGPKGVTKTVKYYKNCDNAYWSCGYDVSKKHASKNCMKKKPGHVDHHTGDNLAPGARIKDKEFSKWA